MIEVINSYLCHECGSDHAISEVVYGKIKINLCADCIEKKEEQREFKFSELSDKAKAYAIYEYIAGDVNETDFEDVWDFHIDNENAWRFDQWGEIIEVEDNG